MINQGTQLTRDVLNAAYLSKSTSNEQQISSDMTISKDTPTMKLNHSSGAYGQIKVTDKMYLETSGVNVYTARSLTADGGLAVGSVFGVTNAGAVSAASYTTAGSISITGSGTLSVAGTSTLTGNVTFVGSAYFANGTTYYVDSSGNAKFNSITSGGAITVPTGDGSTSLKTDAYNYIGLVSLNSNTWLRNAVGTWTFQGETGMADNLAKTFSIYMPTPNTTAGSNDKLVEIGQRVTAGIGITAGAYKGVKIVQYTGSAITDGELYSKNISLKNAGTGAYYLTLVSSDTLTANRTLTFATGDTNRTLTINTDATIAHSTHAQGTDTGTTATDFILDSDNVSTGVDQKLRFNRGSSGNDAALMWDETNDKFILHSDTEATTKVLSRLDVLNVNGYTVAHNTHAQNTDTGTTSTTFLIDNDNATAGVNAKLAFERGSSVTGDASLYWDATNAKFILYADDSNSTKSRLDVASINGYTIAHNSHDPQNLFSHVHVYSTGTTDVTNSPYTASSTTDQMQFLQGSNVTLSMSSTGVITIAAADTATATDDILDGSNTGTAIRYSPYTSKQSGLTFDTGTTNPDGTNRLNLNGVFYATTVYSGGNATIVTTDMEAARSEQYGNIVMSGGIISWYSGNTVQINATTAYVGGKRFTFTGLNTDAASILDLSGTGNSITGAYVYINSSGALAKSTTTPAGNYILLATYNTTSAGALDNTSIKDISNRQILSGGKLTLDYYTSASDYVATITSKGSGNALKLNGNAMLVGGTPTLTIASTTSDQTEGGRIRFTEFTTGSLQGAYIHYDASANYFYLGTHDTNDSTIANDTVAISIKRTNQNVGIGTTSPGSRLQIGDATNSTGDEILTITSKADAGIKLIADTDDTDETHNPYIYFAQDNSSVTAWVGNVGNADVNPLNTTYTGMLANAFGMGTNNAWALQLGTNGNARLTILSDGTVGIGTNAPGAKLQIEGGATISYATPGTTKGNIHINQTGINGDTASITFGAANGTSASPSKIDSAQAGIYVQGDGTYGTKMYFATSNLYSTGSQVRMMIDAAGYVGIGTTTLTEKLQVVQASDSAAFAVVNQTTATRKTRISSGTNGSVIDAAGATSGYGLHFSVNGSEKARITDSGYLGVGVTTVSAPLQVSGDFGTNVMITSSGTGEMILGKYTGSATPVPFDLQAASSTNDNSSTFGVLHLTRMNAAADGAGANLHFRVKKNDGSAQEVAAVGGIIEAGLSTSTTVKGALAFLTTDNGTTRSEKMRLTSTGNLGIGLNNPSALLHVNGDVLYSGSLNSGNLNNAINGTAGWMKLGTLTIPQQGYSANIKIFSGVGFNALDSQIGVIEINIRTSNASATSGGGTAVSAFAYRYGGSGTAGMGSSVKLVQNAAGTAATTLDVYLYMDTYIGMSAYQVRGAINIKWTGSSTPASDPGAASSTVYVVPMYFRVWDPMYTKNSTVDDGAGNASFGGTVNAGGMVSILSGGIAQFVARTANPPTATNPEFHFESNRYALTQADMISWDGTNLKRALSFNTSGKVWTANNTLDDGSGIAQFGSGSMIKGTGTGASNGAWLGFYESNGTTRTGFVGDGSNGDSDITLGSDSGNVKLATSGGVGLAVNTTLGVTTKYNTLDNGSGLAEFGSNASSGLAGVTFKYEGNPTYGMSMYMPRDNGSAQSSYKITANYSSNRLSFSHSTATQTYGSDPSALTYTELMTIASGGNVGVGAASPGAKFHVSDTASAPSTGTVLVESTGGNAHLAIKAYTTTYYAYMTFFQGSAGKFEIGIDPTYSNLYINPNVQGGATNASMYFTRDGKVGVGTLSPDSNSKLDVNGTAKATAFKTGSFTIQYNSTADSLDFIYG